jgi:hypothetical protein
VSDSSLSRAALFLLATALALPASPAFGEVVAVNVAVREDVLGGKPFGEVGAYEKLAGTIDFAFDPGNPANRRVVDIERAPRNAAGLVEARADFMVLRPSDPARGRKVVFVEVSNRGGKAALAYFNRGAFALDPTTPGDFGDGLLLRQGLTLVWVGWQFDVPAGGGLLRLRVPVATDGGAPIEGVVRSDWTVDGAVATLPLAHRDHVAYPVDVRRAAEAVLTVRDGRLAPRRIVPRDQWRFAKEVDGRGVDDVTHIYRPGGFEPGKIYELVYPARDPAVVGLGLAVVRDVVSYAKHAPRSLFPARYGVAFGVSQTGRFLRHFIYQGFNTDERGRRAFDGMLIHAAGAGRGSFNHRFAQPSRDAHRYSAFFYPTDLFPFTSRSERDPETGAMDGLFAHERPEHLPKVFATNSGYEYWGRAASLVSTAADGRTDVAPMDNERLYHLAGGQHFVVRFPPSPDSRLGDARTYRGNPLDYLPTLRALLTRLVAWVVDGVEPPPSVFPRIADGSLVPVDRVRFPAIPGLAFPTVVHEAYRLDFGGRWRDGVITIEPPKLGSAFPALVPQVDADGNEMGGLRAIELLAAVATYTPWALRTGFPAAPHELMDFYGTWSPFPRTEAERQALGDPRPSLELRYGGEERFLDAARRGARSLADRGLLLEEDVPRVLARARSQWNWTMKN